MGKSTINGPFSIAMLNYQRVIAMDMDDSSLMFIRCPKIAA